jgi:Glycosyl hydrolases family 16
MHFIETLRGYAARLLVTALTLGAVALFATVGVAGAAIPAPPSGFSLLFGDDFNGAAGTGVNTTDWLYDTGTCYPGCPAQNWGTGEVESMTTSTANVFQDGAGHLDIKPIHTGTDPNAGWTSGRIETQRTDFDPGPGGVLIMQGSLQQPNVSGAAAAGYWPAFWSLGTPFRGVYTNWPQAGEIDLMEDINGLSSEFGTLHCGFAPGGPCNENTGLGSGQHACAGCQTGFHTYAVQIDRSTSPEQIRWYLDGTQFFSVTENQPGMDATTWNNAVHHGFFMILNVAIGGAFPAAFGGGPTASTQSGVPMIVDYVAVYRKAGTADTTPPSAPTNLSSPSHTDVSASLTWNASTDNVGVTGYQIFRNGSQVATSSTTSFTDAGLTASTTYSYVVKAVDAAGNVSAASNTIAVTTSASSGGGGSSGVFYLRSGGALSSTPGTSASTVSIPSAGGGNHDGTPTNAISFLVTGLSGTYSSGATAFGVYVDSGGCAGNGVQARVSYDFNGDGTYDRVETYHYFATDPVSGWESYTQA